MKKQVALILIFLIFIVGLFSLWQFNLYQKLSKETLSCGGDWSYFVKCPFGSYYRSLGEGPLAGGFCKPLLAPLFEIINKSKEEKPQNLQTPKSTKIINHEEDYFIGNTVNECKIKVNIIKMKFSWTPNF